MKSFLSFLLENTNPVTVKVMHGAGGLFTSFDAGKARMKNDFFGGGLGYFTDSHEIARSYAKGASKETKTPHVYHTTLKMDNVFDVDHDFTGSKLQRMLPKDTEKFARHAGLLNAGNMENRDSILNDLESGRTTLKGHQLFWGLSEGGTKTTAARNHLMKHGYDGLRYNGGENMKGAIRHNVYVPYHAKSITIHKVEKL